eukprot:FR740504.1.p1 GENE.FR740504.1~~FR740504.1.p1  ORF type:complete len:336 (+),score=74.62 FR740504.1:91-1098(+)
MAMRLSPKFMMGCGVMCFAVYRGIIPRGLVAVVGTLVMGVVGMIVVFQENILYMPVIQGFTTPASNPTGYRSPGEKEYRMDFEDVYVQSKDGLKIHGWFLPAAHGQAPLAPTILFCHENAGNIGLRLQEFSRVRRELNVNQLVFDYRGYGYSEGKPSEQGLIEDTLAMLAHLQGKAAAHEINGNKIILCGRSLGGAVAVQVAVAVSNLPKITYPPAALIIENSFTSISDMVNCKFPFLDIPFFKKFFLRLSWESLDAIGKRSLPVLFLSSTQDEIVPADHMPKPPPGLRLGLNPKKIPQFSGPPQRTFGGPRGGPGFWAPRKGPIPSRNILGETG